MNYVHEVINYLTGLPASDWTTVASYLAGSTLVASILQVAKYKLNFAEAKKLVLLATGVLSFLTAFADFLIQSNPNLSALPWLGHVTGLVLAGAVFMHRFAVSPTYYALQARLKRLSTVLKELDQTSVATSAAEVANLDQFQV